MTPNLPPVLPGFSEPIKGPLKEAEYRSKDIAGIRLGEWKTGYSGMLAIWFSLRLGSAIARANGIGGEQFGIPEELESPKPDEGEAADDLSEAISYLKGWCGAGDPPSFYVKRVLAGLEKKESDLAAARASLSDMEAKANRNRQIRDSLVKLFKDDGWQDDCTLINQLTNMNFD